MTILHSDTQRDLRNLATASLSLLAYQFKCEVADILTLINPQPSSHAPAARASAPPSDAQAEGSAPSSSATPSQAKAADDATSGSAMSEPLAPAGGPQGAEAASRADAGRAASATSEVMDVTAGETAPVSPKTATRGEGAAAPAAGESPATSSAEVGAQPAGGENVGPPKNRRTKNLDAALAGGTRVGEATDGAVGSGAPLRPDGTRVTMRARIKAVHYEHPDWTAQQVAEFLGVKKGAVTSSLFDARQARNAELGIVEPAPAPNPQKPIAPPPAEGFTLKYRVHVVHQQHPAWTATLIAKHLGANVNSVTTYLTQLRNAAGEIPASEPARVLPNGAAGEIEARMREAARLRSARLGKPS